MQRNQANVHLVNCMYMYVFTDEGRLLSSPDLVMIAPPMMVPCFASYWCMAGNAERMLSL